MADMYPSIQNPKSKIQNRFWVGTAGWSYDDWKGIFYPAGMPAKGSLLGYYQKFFNLVEVDATFYHVMPPRYADKWCRDVEENPDFLFALKLWRGLTHERRDEFPKDEARAIKEMCGILQRNGRLGTLLLQFPWSFKFTDENLAYLGQLLDIFGEFPQTVEIRHTSWLQDEYRHFLRQRSVAFCNIDQPQLSNCLPPTSIATAPFSYLRLHGRNYANWFRENQQGYERYDYLYSPQEVSELAELAKALAEQTSRVMVTGNNHYRSQAAINALMFRAALEGKAKSIPAGLKRAFPELLKDVPVEEEEMEESTVPESGQLDLFRE